MPIPAVLTAWLVLAAVLATSGVGKVRHPEGAAEAAASLGVSAALRGPGWVRAHPWLELALAVLLLVLPHPFSVVTAAATLVLFLAYLALVCRAVASGADVTCHCFGSVGTGVVDGWTVARNAVLVALGGVVLVDAALGESALARFGALSGSSARGGSVDAGSVGGDNAWWWLAALVVTAVVTYLVVRPGERADRARGSSLERASAAAPALRMAIPDVPVTRAKSAVPVSLRDVVAERRALLLLLSPGCGPCRMISAHLKDWSREMSDTGLVVAHAISFSAMRDSQPEWEPFFAQDTEGAVARAFDDPARPWAVLLGADGRVESAPAQGYTAIASLVDDLRSDPDRANPDQTNTDQTSMGQASADRANADQSSIDRASTDQMGAR
ncbi:MauE/DoxX family redox-associated membrane protein [Ornithinimicrobium faecis]|uniref:MauE/DoxX family redox-associated membrane protein n=1 Tax=Ornithinimicrobium faecis TaxID=2934158 RepID=UPI0021193757|nr:MauE/DoxX family redox-associated membrane protein [Ornithinimicrobium sp. HY1745]